MTIRIAVITALLFLCAVPSFAVCTKSGTVNATSTVILNSNDLAGLIGRHYFLIQNTGTANPMNVAISTGNHATSSDVYLAPGQSWVMTQQDLKMVPGGDVSAISAGGTSYSVCDW